MMEGWWAGAWLVTHWLDQPYDPEGDILRTLNVRRLEIECDIGSMRPLAGRWDGSVLRRPTEQEQRDFINRCRSSY